MNRLSGHSGLRCLSALTVTISWFTSCGFAAADEVNAETTPRPYLVSGTGALKGKLTLINSEHAYRGTGSLEGDTLDILLYQDISNPIGKATLEWNVVFDITTLQGTQTVLGCTGLNLICGNTPNVVGTESGTTPYLVSSLDASNRSAISWEIDMKIEVQGYGPAHTTSSMRAIMPP